MTAGTAPTVEIAAAGAAADRATQNAAMTLALTLPGDTVLYLLLPLYAAQFGVSLAEAGVLLAANRLIRIVGYGWVAQFYASRGPRAACLLAVAGSVLAALGYATLSGLWPLLVARLAWGLSFAAMNIANQAIPTAIAEGAVRRTARARTIVAMGPTVALVAGALIAHFYGPRTVFALLTGVALLAFVFAQGLPSEPEDMKQGGRRFGAPDPISLWSFSSGFVLDGIFIFGLGLLAAASYPNEAIIATGLAMALRYGTEVLFSSAGGKLGQTFGARSVLLVLSIGAAAAMILMAGSPAWLWVGAGLTIVLRALTAPLVAPVIAEAFPGPARVPALARNATWRDIGAAAGPLAAGVLFTSMPPLSIYAAAAVLLAMVSLGLMRRARAEV